MFGVAAQHAGVQACVCHAASTVVKGTECQAQHWKKLALGTLRCAGLAQDCEEVSMEASTCRICMRSMLSSCMYMMCTLGSTGSTVCRRSRHHCMSWTTRAPVWCTTTWPACGLSAHGYSSDTFHQHGHAGALSHSDIRLLVGLHDTRTQAQAISLPMYT